MKRLSLAMMGLAIAGLMTMVSCRKPNVNNFNTTGEKITFSATIDNGSKTALVGDEIWWTTEDKISINGMEYTLASDPGKTSGEFVGGDVEDFEGKYFASYPYSSVKGYENSGSSVKFNIPETFTLADQIPMVAYTIEKGGGLGFKSMVNVLALSLTGTQSLTDIVVSSTEKLSGDFTVTVSNELTNPGIPTVADGGTKRTINFPVALQLDPSVAQRVNVVLPVFGSEDSKVIVEFIGEDGDMTVGPFALKDATSSSESFATTPNHRYTMDVVVSLENWEASVATIPVCAVHSKCASSGGVVTGTGVEEQGVCWGTSANPTIAGSHYVHQYKYEYPAGTFSLTPKSSTENNTFTGFMSGLTAGTKYYVRAYIKKGSNVKYGGDEIFTTLSTEPTVEYVDLGLDSHTLWAKCNLGATTPDGYGDYYQWGDLAACNDTKSEKKVNCGWQSDRFRENLSKKFTKYCPSDKTDKWYSGAGSPDNKTQLDYADDCVRQTLGGNWRMPTEAEFNELKDNTTKTWKAANEYITIGGNQVSMPVAGYYCVSTKTGYTGKYIFLPAAGNRAGTSLSNAGSNGSYLSSSLKTSDPIYVHFLSFKSSSFTVGSGSRSNGFSVRPVQ